MRALPGVVLAAAAAVTVVPATASAGVGLGLFIGDPIGVTLKADLKPKTALEVLVGGTTYRDGRGTYGHVTFLAAPFVAHGDSVSIPFRLGIGGAAYEAGDDVGFSVRAPFQLAFQMHSAPIEFYLEVSLRVVLAEPADNTGDLDVDGGGGFRFYF
jgi:hypothetical protein